jgi:hypothetical protein
MLDVICASLERVIAAQRLGAAEAERSKCTQSLLGSLQAFGLLEVPAVAPSETSAMPVKSPRWDSRSCI